MAHTIVTQVRQAMVEAASGYVKLELMDAVGRRIAQVMECNMVLLRQDAALLRLLLLAWQAGSERLANFLIQWNEK